MEDKYLNGKMKRRKMLHKNKNKSRRRRRRRHNVLAKMKRGCGM